MNKWSFQFAIISAESLKNDYRLFINELVSLVDRFSWPNTTKQYAINHKTNQVSYKITCFSQLACRYSFVTSLYCNISYSRLAAIMTWIFIGLSIKVIFCKQTMAAEKVMTRRSATNRGYLVKVWVVFLVQFLQ